MNANRLSIFSMLLCQFLFLNLIVLCFTMVAEDKKLGSATPKETKATVSAQKNTRHASVEQKKQQRIPKKFDRKIKKPYQKTFKAKKVPKTVVVIPQKDIKKDQLLKKPIRDLNLDELIEAKQYAMVHGDKELTIKYIERILAISNNQEDVRASRLELADIYFEKGDMKNSGKLYQKYVQFYPGSQQRDYAEYKSVLCRFYARLKPPLDQSLTRKTISMANRYLDRTDTKHYEDDVTNIRQTCYKDLYEYEMEIVNQYLILEKLMAAQTRLESIKAEFLEVMPEIEPILIEREGIVAQKQGKETVVTQKMDELKQRFPAYNPNLLIAKIKPKKSFVDLF